MLPISIGLLFESLVAFVLFGATMLPAGYLVATMRGIACPRRASAVEVTLWSLALGFPAATLLAVALGCLQLGPAQRQHLTLTTFAVLATLAAVRLVARMRGKLGTAGSLEQIRRHRTLLLVLAVCCCYCIAATMPVTWHGHREEPVQSNDWYIRIPLLHAAAHTGVPPINPLFTLRGANPTLQYYYFFYVLAAVPMRLGAVPAPAALVAGVLWSLLAFFAVAWLMIQYVVLPASAVYSSIEWRTLALLFVPVSLITGLDILPTLLNPALGGPLLPTIYWWNADGSSTWPGLVTAAPHHLAGLSMALLAYLLMVLPAEVPSHRWRNALLAGCCLAAAIGTSSFMAGGVLFAAVLLAADRAYQRQFAAAACSLGVIGVALLLDFRYLNALWRSAAVTGTGAVIGGAQHLHRLPLALVLRNWHHAFGLTGFIVHRLHGVQPRGIPGYLEALPVLALLYAVDIGFFAWIVYAQIRQSRRSTGPTSEPGRALWCLFAAFAVLSTFVSSAPLQGGLNDLGHHTLFGMRTVLALRACPLVVLEWRARSTQMSVPGTTRSPLRFAVPAALALLGVAGTLYDVTVQRIYLPLVDAGQVLPIEPFLFERGVGVRYTELAEAWAAIGRQTPSNAVVQANPDGRLQRPFLLYLNRRVAAGDRSCEAGFGGDPQLCLTAIVRPLLTLYDQANVASSAQSVSNPGTAGSTATGTAAFANVCYQQQLAALVATDYDSVWQDTASWVWHEPPLYAGRTVRVLRCPLAP